SPSKRGAVKASSPGQRSFTLVSLVTKEFFRSTVQFIFGGFVFQPQPDSTGKQNLQRFLEYQGLTKRHCLSGCWRVFLQWDVSARMVRCRKGRGPALRISFA